MIVGCEFVQKQKTRERENITQQLRQSDFPPTSIGLFWHSLLLPKSQLLDFSCVHLLSVQLPTQHLDCIPVQENHQLHT